MRRSIVIVSAVAVLVAALAGQNDQWQKYTNRSGNFSVLMPVQPKDTPTPNASTETHTIQAISGGAAYTVVYVVNPSEQQVTEANYKIYRDAFVSGLPNCKVVTESAAAPALPGYIGRWYRMDCNVDGKALSFAGNLYWGKRYAYAVLTMFSTAPSIPPTAKRFSDSFANLGQ